MAFCDVMRELLEEKNVSQKTMAKELNLGVTTLGNYFQGTREPDFSTLRMIAAYFNVPADYLLEMPNPPANTQAEAKLLNNYRNLSPQDRELLIEQSALLLRLRKKQTKT